MNAIELLKLRHEELSALIENRKAEYKDVSLWQARQSECENLIGLFVKNGYNYEGEK